MPVYGCISYSVVLNRGDDKLQKVKTQNKADYIKFLNALLCDTVFIKA